MKPQQHTAEQLLDIIRAHATYMCNGVERCVGCDIAADGYTGRLAHDNDCTIAKVLDLTTEADVERGLCSCECGDRQGCWVHADDGDAS